MYSIKSKIWILGEKGTYLGEGRVRLLENIVKTGSISKAAKEMNMSYKKAWELVNKMNKQSEEPLVKKVAGGKKGGGAIVSEKGKDLIERYNQLNASCFEFLDQKMKELELDK